MKVRLIEMPDGLHSQHYPVTLGGVYEVFDRAGGCYIISTDVPGETAIIHAGRFVPMVDRVMVIMINGQPGVAIVINSGDLFWSPHAILDKYASEYAVDRSTLGFHFLPVIPNPMSDK